MVLYREKKFHFLWRSRSTFGLEVGSLGHGCSVA
jgi:hypothetical protein